MTVPRDLAVSDGVERMARAARGAARVVARSGATAREDALSHMADALDERAE